MNSLDDYQEDGRVLEVMELLGRGKDRDDIASRYQISRSGLDQYMRRHHMVWKHKYQTYVMTPEHPNYVEQEAVPELPSGPKVRKVLVEFSKPGVHAKEVARRVGFMDVREMAKYMETRGYAWSPDALTYVRIKNLHNDDIDHVDSHGQTNLDEDYVPASFEVSNAPQVDWGRYLPLLQLLEENKNKLTRIIDQAPSEEIEIPRYVLPGESRPRSIQMVDRLKELVEDFSRERNIRQREVIEVALIEFFRKYGYGAEVDTFLTFN